MRSPTMTQCCLMLSGSKGRRNASPAVTQCHNKYTYTDWSIYSNDTSLKQAAMTARTTDVHKINILLDAAPTLKLKWKAVTPTAASYYGRWGCLILAAATKNCGMTWTTNHNKAAGRGWSVSQSQHHTKPVIHCRWHLSVATLVVTDFKASVSVWINHNVADHWHKQLCPSL